MAEYDASIRINANIDSDKIDAFKINKESMERLNKSVEKLAQVMIDAIGKDTFQAVQVMNENLRQTLLKISPVFERYSYDELLKGFQFTVAEMAEKIGMAQFETFPNIDFGKLFRDSFYQGKYDEASKMAFEYTESEVETEEDISQEELLEIFNEQMEDKIGWQEKLYNKSEEFKRKYFVFYKIFICCLCFLIGEIMSFFAQWGIAYAFGNITSEPEKDSPVIYYFDQRTEVNIIGETDSYYFITYTDSDGNEVLGYSDKEDIEIVPEEDADTIEDVE